MKVIYVHGISQMLAPAKLKHLWDMALFEQDNPDSLQAYWSDIQYPVKQHFALSMEEKIEEVEKDLLKKYLKDVYDYLFDFTKQKAIESRLVKALDSLGGEPCIIVSHSLGSVIAFSVLTKYQKKLDVPLFVTMGSPLGIDQLARKLKEQLGVETAKLSKPPMVKKWLNISDIMDPVASDKTVADEFAGRCIKDVLIINPDTMSTTTLGPHSAVGYLSCKEAKGAVLNCILAYTNPVTKFLYNLGA